MREVNIFLPSKEYSLPRNGSGVRHHLFEIYTRVFGGCSTHVFPRSNSDSILLQSLANLPSAMAKRINVVTQGYSVLAVWTAHLFGQRSPTVIHTWKVPYASSGSFFSKLYDYSLAKLMESASLVVVASRKQERAISNLFPNTRVHFAPVSVDTEYWTPKKANSNLLQQYDLMTRSYVLVVGGNDRNEEIGIRVAASLNLQYVRVTKNASIAQLAETTANRLGLQRHVRILQGIDDLHLISLYHFAFCVLLPTVTVTNPAGLSSLVEAMACGSNIAIEAELAEGYIQDGYSGTIISSTAPETDDTMHCSLIIDALHRNVDREDYMRDNCRREAVDSLNVNGIALGIQKALVGTDLFSET